MADEDEDEADEDEGGVDDMRLVSGAGGRIDPAVDGACHRAVPGHHRPVSMTDLVG